MGELYISEYKELRGVDGGNAQIGEEPSVDQTPVTFSTEAKSDAFAEGTKMIRVYSDTECHIKIGIGPTATVNNKPIAADSPEYFGVTAGQKLSAIDVAV